jgi:uncharacterized protein involved in exopolysaccharide biosynthesis
MEKDVEENEVGLIDLLLVVAENIKLLFFGPIVVGLLALGIGYTLPQSFTSQAILALPTPLATQTQTQTSTQTQTPTQAAVMMVSPTVLDPVIDALKLSKGQPIQVARTGLINQIKPTVGKDGLLRLEVTAPTPVEAQLLANTVIDSWLKSTVPGKQDRADLEQRLAYAKTSLASMQRVLDRLTEEGTSYLNKTLTRGEGGTSIIAVGELQARYFTEVLNIPRSLQGLSRDVVVQPPTLPTEPVAPKKSLITILAVLASGFALLVWVFLCKAWSIAAQESQTGEKLVKLLATMGFKGRPR